MNNHFAQMKKIRHGRVLDIRQKISLGWTMPELHNYCKVNLDVAKVTADSYIDEAAEPYRKKYEKEAIEKYEKEQNKNV